jgi:hypothetical protein
MAEIFFSHRSSRFTRWSLHSPSMAEALLVGSSLYKRLFHLLQPRLGTAAGPLGPTTTRLLKHCASMAPWSALQAWLHCCSLWIPGPMPCSSPSSSEGFLQHCRPRSALSNAAKLTFEDLRWGLAANWADLPKGSSWNWIFSASLRFLISSRVSSMQVLPAWISAEASAALLCSSA